MTENTYKKELSALNALRPQAVDNLIDGLIEKIGLIQYLLSSGSHNVASATKEIAKAVLTLIQKSDDQTIEARKQFDKKQLQRVFFMVANLTLASLNEGPDHASLLMQTCIIIDRHCPELKDTPQVQAQLYQVLASFHMVYPKNFEHIRRALSYADGALDVMNMGFQKQDTGENGSDRRLMEDVQRAVALNNKATIEIRNRNLGAAQELVKQALKLVEHRVYGVIKAGEDLHNKVEAFPTAVKVLQHSYYNLGLTMDRQKESREVYKRALCLYHQYGAVDYRQELLYKKLKKKYNRPLVDVEQPSGREKRHQRLPEIIPLDGEDVPANPNNQSGSGHAFERHRVRLTRKDVPAPLNDDKSISLLNSELPGYMKNGEPRVLLKEMKSAASIDFAASNTLKADGSTDKPGKKVEAPRISKTRTEVKQNRESLIDTKLKEVNDMQPQQTPRKNTSGDEVAVRSDADFEVPHEVQVLDSQDGSSPGKDEERKSRSNAHQLLAPYQGDRLADTANFGRDRILETQGSGNTQAAAETAKFPRMPSVATSGPSKANISANVDSVVGVSPGVDRRQMKLEGRTGISELASVSDRMASRSPSRDATPASGATMQAKSLANNLTIKNCTQLEIASESIEQRSEVSGTSKDANFLRLGKQAAVALPGKGTQSLNQSDSLMGSVSGKSPVPTMTRAPTFGDNAPQQLRAFKQPASQVSGAESNDFDKFNDRDSSPDRTGASPGQTTKPGQPRQLDQTFGRNYAVSNARSPGLEAIAERGDETQVDANANNRVASLPQSIQGGPVSDGSTPFERAREVEIDRNFELNRDKQIREQPGPAAESLTQALNAKTQAAPQEVPRASAFEMQMPVTQQRRASGNARPKNISAAQTRAVNKFQHSYSPKNIDDSPSSDARSIDVDDETSPAAIMRLKQPLRGTRPTTAGPRRQQDEVLQTPPRRGEIDQDAPRVRPNEDAPQMLAMMQQLQPKDVVIPLQLRQRASGDDEVKDAVRECMRRMQRVRTDSRIANYDQMTIEQQMMLYLGRQDLNVALDASEKIERHNFSLNRSFHASLSDDERPAWTGVSRVGGTDVTFTVGTFMRDDGRQVVIECDQPDVNKLQIPLKDLLAALDMVKGTRLIDPSVVPAQHGSLPFRHLDSFAEFCDLLLRHYLTVRIDDVARDIELRENPIVLEAIHCNFIKTGSLQPSLSEGMGVDPSQFAMGRRSPRATNCVMRLLKITENTYKLCITPRLELATLQYLQTMFEDSKNVQRMKGIGEVEVPPLAIAIRSATAPTIEELKPYLLFLENYLLQNYMPFLEKIKGAEAENVEQLRVGDSNWLTGLVLSEKVIHCEYYEKRMFVFHKDPSNSTAEKQAGRIAAIFWNSDTASLQLCLAPPTIQMDAVSELFGQSKTQPYLTRQLAQLYMQSTSLIFENQQASENNSMTSQSVSISEPASSRSVSLNSSSGDEEEEEQKAPAVKRERCALIQMTSIEPHAYRRTNKVLKHGNKQLIVPVTLELLGLKDTNKAIGVRVVAFNRQKFEQHGLFFVNGKGRDLNSLKRFMNQGGFEELLATIEIETQADMTVRMRPRDLVERPMFGSSVNRLLAMSCLSRLDIGKEKADRLTEILDDWGRKAIEANESMTLTQLESYVDFK